ncbi:TPA: TrbC/VirB2 family protein [Klebsiella variicola]|uniref:TrbC/VirB2 family protein n=1 Tax=Enterobacteriaceae TaxID=543 RepID=UPI0002413091|nr:MULTISPECIES: TrbC/VirB2 family protein [Enterobacteriaceae]EIH1839053.1 TrbC/VirB2 family protein [Escherichia coli]EJD3042528.1 TrbC/VirB2 family protein [Salmonella enterica]ELK3459273.1 TrbC/VirB2 family protein [Enterobacter kobei]EMC2649107.1 TrbC/VirB2 family protein [Klebsiella pneumoniae]HCB1534946.1 TrbC/VirB2 family protein [Citrobacter braakii]HDL6532503.1 TrbC/VirB2 family protein [Yersinia enterocolitica]HDR2780118.1 TrbC/VirB2 family protein [Enterobacter mori]HED4052201.1
MTANALFASPVASSAQPSASKVRAVLSSPVFWLMAALVVALLFGAEPAHAANASEGGGSGLPWEGPIAKLVQSISGPVAFGIALLGIIACGATLIWGGEISEFTRRIIYVILVVCIIVFAKNLLTGTMFSGAVIPANVSITADDVATAQQGAGGR